MSDEYDWLLAASGPAGDANSLFALGSKLETSGDVHLAATAYDRAFGLKPNSAEIRDARQALLDRLAVVEHGIRFRYVPAGSFVMGSDDGDPDERPMHPARTTRYWLSETPVSWAAYCDLMDWEPVPYARPRGEGQHLQGFGQADDRMAIFHLLEQNKLRMQYCEDATTHARDWHAHAPEHTWRSGDAPISSRVLFGQPEREDPRRPWRYDRKPMVGVSWQDAEALCHELTTADCMYRLPSEAEWEKAARGGFIGCRYPWGDEALSAARCDYDRFDQFSILPMRRFPPNGYGLYAMSGCVWEWTSDWYDAQRYLDSSLAGGESVSRGQRALRGGSWADCAEVITVSFRMSRGGNSWREGRWGNHLAPNIGFRLCRVERDSSRTTRGHE